MNNICIETETEIFKCSISRVRPRLKFGKSQTQAVPWIFKSGSPWHARSRSSLPAVPSFSSTATLSFPLLKDQVLSQPRLGLEINSLIQFQCRTNLILFFNSGVELLIWILIEKSSKASPPSLNLCSVEKSSIDFVWKHFLLLEIIFLVW